MMFFDFTINTCQYQDRSIPAARTTMNHSQPTQPSEPAEKLQKKGASSKVTGNFIYFMLFFYSFILIFFAPRRAHESAV